jgi:hypothetical protein
MNDDDYGMRLLRPLATEPPGATRIDVTAAMRKGRRARRTRMWSIISGSTAVVVAGATGSAFALSAPAAHPKPDLPTDPVVPVACTATRLPSGGARAAVTGGDPGGTYLVGTSNPSNAKAKAVLVWRDGKLVGDVPQTGRSAVMSDINASGVAVGTTTEGSPLPYVYRAGQVSRLAGIGTAQAINDAGTIAGTHGISIPEVGDQTQNVPQRWAGPGAQPEEMKLPPGALGGKAMDIAEDGTVVVDLSTKTRVEQSYLWFPDGTSRAIEAPKVGHGRITGFLSAYFRSGWLYGDVAIFEPLGGASSGPSLGATDSNGPEGDYTYDTVPYRYHVASGTWQKLPPGKSSDLMVDPATHVTLEAYIGKQIYTYPAPITNNADDDFQVITVSDDGHTAGGSSLSQQADPNHRDEPFRWHCS